MNSVRLLAWVYCLLFLFVVALGHLPGLTDDQGQLFGLFQIDLVDDILHLGSGIWAGIAAWRSTRASVFYFRAFGALYSLDAVFGLLFGQGILDGGIFLYGVTPVDISTRVFANLPHVVIGGLALLIGFVLSRRSPERQYASP
ncbi:MAG TPA: DUF4383 domain-containing protein [Caldilineaceae bacterium]|nr:DUF4383 domain-containing protein [Caldilineaceae bacterium]